MFSTLVKKEREKNISQGEVIGITKILKSKLKTLLTKKFEAISEEIISKIDNCDDIKKLENAIDNILDYTNSNEVIELLK